MSIHVPGQSRSEPNPLLVLATALDKSNQHLTAVEGYLAKIATNTKKEARHIYAIALREPGVWGTYCLACSDEAQEFTYPCLRFGEADATKPPSHISILPTVEPD